MHLPRRSAVLAVLAPLCAVAPWPARAEPRPEPGVSLFATRRVHLLDAPLASPWSFAGAAQLEGGSPSLPPRVARLGLARALDSAPGGEAKPGTPPSPSGRAAPSGPGSIDFDLLGPAPAAPPVDEGALRLRRTLLGWHQGVGLAMFGLELATTVVGQLNYDDKFGGANTNKYVQTHELLAFSTLAAFAVSGTLALLAPAPLKPNEGFDRVTLHKYSMFTATALMATEAVLGVWTQSREGYLNQKGIAVAHLAIGYATLAAVGTGIGALVF